MSQAFNNFRAGLPPPAECLAILVGVAEVSIFGLAGLANPVEFAKGYGLPMTAPTPATKSERKNERAYIASVAARNIQNGVLILTLGCYVRDRRATGIAIASGVIATMADALIVKAYGVEEAVWGHVIGMINSVAIGGSLLYWGRTDPWW